MNITDKLAEKAMDIDTGDTVLHRPTGEEWLVAGVENGRLMWYGWPPGTADVADCELIRKATTTERDKLLHELADMRNDDKRRRLARSVLSKSPDCVNNTPAWVLDPFTLSRRKTCSDA